MLDGVRWVAITKSELPGVIAEGFVPPTARTVQSPVSQSDDACIGCINSDGQLMGVVTVLSQSNAKEVLAWIATYSPGSFPLSQSTRVFLSGDISESLIDKENETESFGASYWPSIVLGELLGQGEFSSNFDEIALSRAVACYSYTRARAQLCNARQSRLIHRCVERLQAIETDGLFAKRPIGITDLQPIWDFASRELLDDTVLRSIIRTVRSVVAGESRVPMPLDANLFGTRIFDVESLSVGPMEDRVRAFQAFLVAIRGTVDDTNAQSAAMLVAAAAVLVGNGTSHISLLEEFGQGLPVVFVWFGFFAGLSGPKGWDQNWNRSSNYIARLLRMRNSLIDPPGFDLSWVEYDFSRAVARPKEFLRHIPKLYPRVLSVEIVPGAVCQFRMLPEISTSSSAREPRGQGEIKSRAAESTAQMQQLTTSLVEVERLLARSRNLLQHAIISMAEPQQPTLFDPPKKGGRRSRSPKLD